MLAAAGVWAGGSGQGQNTPARLCHPLALMSAPPSAYSPLLPRQHLPSAATAAHDPASYASALGARVYSRLTDEPPAAAAARTDSRAGDTPGDLRYKRIVHALTRTDPIRLLPYQLDFVRACMTPTLPQIYGDEWVRDRAGVLARHGIDNFYEEVFYIASRRMGKTLTMAMFAVAYALSIPSDGSHPFRIAIFSVNKDAALRFIEECRVVMRSIDPALLDEFEISGKADRIVFRSRTDPNDVRTITSYPGRGNVRCLFFCFCCCWVSCLSVARARGGT